MMLRNQRLLRAIVWRSGPAKAGTTYYGPNVAGPSM
jgi:hypothetical protein